MDHFNASQNRIVPTFFNYTKPGNRFAQKKSQSIAGKNFSIDPSTPAHIFSINL